MSALSGLVLCFIAAGTTKLSLSKARLVFNSSHLVLFLVLCLVFSCNDFLRFFIMFEVSALGIFSIIIGWGYQPERISAGTTLLIYTSLASLPILGACLLIKSRLKIADFWALTSLASHEGTWYSVGGGGLLGLSVTLAFLVKFPVYFVHL